VSEFVDFVDIEVRGKSIFCDFPLPDVVLKSIDEAVFVEGEEEGSFGELCFVGWCGEIGVEE
jgi:hypothetical protein